VLELNLGESTVSAKQQWSTAGQGAAGGTDHFINRLGRWDDPIAVAKVQARSPARVTHRRPAPQAPMP